jgi:hypothetical protein
MTDKKTAVSKPKVSKAKTKKKKIGKTVETNVKTKVTKSVLKVKNTKPIKNSVIISSIEFPHSKKDLKTVNALLSQNLSESERFTIDEETKCSSILCSLEVLSSTSYANNEHMIHLLFDVAKGTFVQVQHDTDTVEKVSILKDISSIINENGNVKTCDDKENRVKSLHQFFSLFESAVSSKNFESIPTLAKEEKHHLEKIHELSNRREEHAKLKYDELRSSEIKIENKIFDANEKQKKASTFDSRDKWSFKVKSLEKKLKKLREENQKVRDGIKAEFDLAQKSDSLRQMKITANVRSVLFINSSKYVISSGEKQWLFLPLFSSLILVKDN